MKSIQSSMTVTKCQEKIIYVALSFIGRIVCTSRIPCVVMCCERQAGKKVKFKSRDHESAMFKKKKKAFESICLCQNHRRALPKDSQTNRDENGLLIFCV